MTWTTAGSSREIRREGSGCDQRWPRREAVRLPLDRAARQLRLQGLGSGVRDLAAVQREALQILERMEAEDLRVRHLGVRQDELFQRSNPGDRFEQRAAVRNRTLDPELLQALEAGEPAQPRFTELERVEGELPRALDL